MTITIVSAILITLLCIGGFFFGEQFLALPFWKRMVIAGVVSLAFAVMIVAKLVTE